MKRLFFAWTIVFVTTSFSCIRDNLYAQTPPVKSDCGVALNNLVSKIESDYIGYRIAIRGKRDNEYRRHVNTFKIRAQRTSNANCILVLQDFTRFFRDGHLFVQENPTLTADDVERLTKAAEQSGKGESEIRNYLLANAKRLDPIEGVWYDKDGHRFGIIRDYKPNRRDFAVIMLSDGVERWLPGQVKAEFKKLLDGSYSDVFYSGRHFPLHLNGYARGQEGGAALRRNGLILHIAPISWGKSYPLRPEEQNLIDAADPHRPTIRTFGESTVIVSVPSHSPEYIPLLKSLVEKFHDQILKSENLIIDIRGDEGGGTGTTSVLMPFMVTSSKRPARYWVGDRTMILSSADNISYVKQMESQGWVPKHLVERLEANRGNLVSFSDPTSEPDSTDEKKDAATEFPRNVAILMDSSVVSAGEAFVIQAMKNEKVTLFGENSGGVIDYQSISIIPLKDCRALGFTLGYPMFAASNSLPNGGVNSTGISPDVSIGRNAKDPMQFIVDYYSKLKKR